MPLPPANLMRGLFPMLFHVKPIPRTRTSGDDRFPKAPGRCMTSAAVWRRKFFPPHKEGSAGVADDCIVGQIDPHVCVPRIWSEYCFRQLIGARRRRLR